MIADLNFQDENLLHPFTMRFIAGGGGASIPEDVHRRVRETFGIPLVEGYGLTETISQTHLNPPDKARERCIGVPTFNTRCLILDKEDQHPLPAGEVGEIAVSGPQVLDCYWNRPDETAEAFIEIDGLKYFRTGDLGYFDEGGYYYVVDRLKRMINAAGFKVWPAEVEARLHDHPAVSEACIVGVGDPKRGETVRALIILKPEYTDRIDSREIIDWSRGQMSAYKYPRSVVFVSELPRLASGKIDWRAAQADQNKSECNE
ncbi:MAG: AMP-binding protein [Parvularculaceae bacterium]